MSASHDLTFGRRQMKYRDRVTYGAYPLSKHGRHYGKHLMWCELYEVSRGLSLAGFDLSRNVIDWANEKWMEKNRYARIMKSYEGLGMKRAVAWPIAKWQQYDCGTKVRKALDMAKRKWILVRKRYLSGLGFTSLSVPGTVVDGHISGSTTTDDPTISEQNQTANSSPIGDSDEEWEEI